MSQTQCICEICTCGRHACKMEHQTPKGDIGHSMYTETFKTPQLQKTTCCKPPPTVNMSSEPLQSMTTHKTDYIKHPYSSRQMTNQRNGEYEVPTQPFQKWTAYQQDYRAFRGEKTKSMKPPNAHRSPGEFKGTSNYKNDYVQWNIERRKPIDEGYVWEHPSQPFEKYTTHQLDYVSKPISTRDNYKPRAYAATSTDPLSNNTDYRSNYTKHQIGPKFTRQCDEYVPNATPFEGFTTTGLDFITKKSKPAESCKPDNKAFSSSEPFAGTTTFTNDYRKWPLSKQVVKEEQEYQPPTTRMNFNTVYGNDYRGQNAPLVKAIKNEGTRKELPPFEGLSNYTQNYRKWSPVKARVISNDGDASLPSPPFVGVSNYQENYRQHKIKPVDMNKPKTQLHTTSCPFDGTTMYRTEYFSRKLEPCKACAYINSKSNEDRGGHQYYRVVGNK